MTKEVVSFLRKNRVTPSVTTPGDINPSDATVLKRVTPNPHLTAKMHCQHCAAMSAIAQMFLSRLYFLDRLNVIVMLACIARMALEPALSMTGSLR